MKVCTSILECVRGEGKKCGAVDVKRQTLKWFGYMEQMEESRMTRRMYACEIEGGNVTGRPPMKYIGYRSALWREGGTDQ